jgi:hypothetical protein
VPRNVFFVRLDGRVAALLVGRGGEVRIQDAPESRWRLHRVCGVTRRLWPWRLGLALADGGQLRVVVYGGDETARLELGSAGLRGAVRWRRLFAYRGRRRAAERLRGMLGGQP